MTNEQQGDGRIWTTSGDGGPGTKWEASFTVRFRNHHRAVHKVRELPVTLSLERIVADGHDEYLYSLRASERSLGRFTTTGRATTFDEGEGCMRSYLTLVVNMVMELHVFKYAEGGEAWWDPKEQFKVADRYVSEEERRSAQVESTNVVELRPAARDEAVVTALRRLLEQAEAGELVGLAYVGAFRGNGAYSRGLYGEVGEQQVVFGLERLKYRIVKEAEER